MKTLFENKDLRLTLTGHDYDFVGGIEVLHRKTLTFFFAEETDEEGYVVEDETEFKGVYCDVQPYDENDGGYDAAEELAQRIGANNWFTLNRKAGWTGFLSDCTERGQFLALVKAYCPERMKDITWA